jgi:hypothetical protein
MNYENLKIFEQNIQKKRKNIKNFIDYTFSYETFLSN